MIKEPYSAPFVVAIDTREQSPFPMLGIATMRKTLRTGDYSIIGLEHRVTVERKSYQDAWGSMSDGRARFERCIKRMAAMERAAIVIECSLTQLAIQPSYIKRVMPASVVGGLISWSAQFGIPVFFCDSREFAERITLRYLAAFWKHRRDVDGFK